MTNVPSGWYPNPHNPGEEMYWDGTSWSGAARKLSASRIEEATMVRADATAAAQQAGASFGTALPFATASFATPQPAALQLIPPDGEQWHAQVEPREASTSNWLATVALILGCCGALVTAVPFFIGLIGGGILNLCAIGFCVFGVLRGRQLDGKGVVLSLVGGALGAFGLVAMTIGAGTAW
jgi:hypothetical protein